MTASEQPHILIVDDEEDMRWVLCNLFTEAGYRVSQAAGGEEALALAAGDPPHILLTDMRMPRCNGIELIRRLRKEQPGVPAIVLSAVDQVDTAVAAMKEGACDYAVKPFDNEKLVTLVGRTLAEWRPTTAPPSTTGGLVDLGVSAQAAELAREATRVAATELTLLIEGPSGTGKEFMARAVHALSSRVDGPFIAVDCGALPSSLAESLLFGHRRGAFTGADRDREGLFTAAHGGTLFLDEIGNLPLEIQPKLLRVLQERQLVPLGEAIPVPFDARIICATNVDLHAMAERGEFRLDLLHRINEYLLRLPPLKERPDDILYFAGKFVANETPPGDLPREIPPAAAEVLCKHPWPGNLRELRNVIRRALVLAGTGPLEPEHLHAPEGDNRVESEAPRFSGDHSLTEEVRRASENLEREWILQILEETGGNKAQAARLLKVDYTTLHRKLKRHGLDEE